jgi:hypothetical protein
MDRDKLSEGGEQCPDVDEYTNQKSPLWGPESFREEGSNKDQEMKMFHLYFQ